MAIKRCLAVDPVARIQDMPNACGCKLVKQILVAVVAIVPAAQVLVRREAESVPAVRIAGKRELDSVMGVRTRINAPSGLTHREKELALVAQTLDSLRDAALSHPEMLSKLLCRALATAQQCDERWAS